MENLRDRTRPDGAAARPLRIGMMLRAIDEVDGPGVYVRALCRAVFEHDTRNTYVLFYMRDEQAGGFAEFPNVVERVLRARSKLLWDQILVPLAARRESLDVLFHHKFSVPVWSPCPTIVQQRGSAYWTLPQWYSPINRLYSKIAIPLYCRRAKRILTNSDTLAKELADLVGIPRSRMRTLYAAADERFHRAVNANVQCAVRRKYDLPKERFLLSVATGQTGGKSSASAENTVRVKNVDAICQAYGQLGTRGSPRPPLVIVGRGFDDHTRSRLLALTGSPENVQFAGYVEHVDMPAVYSTALALVFPSHHESFGIPLVEAMACGCPVITSNAGACPEVIGGAGLIVDPNSIEEIARAMQRVINDRPLAAKLRAQGIERAADFSWAASARKLVREFSGVVADSGGAAAGDGSF